VFICERPDKALSYIDYVYLVVLINQRFNWKEVKNPVGILGISGADSSKDSAIVTFL